MNCHVRYIGVVDLLDRVHAVEFGPGVNVITGKSSTGKSAMIEIFDYCFGSSDFTVPEGVITANAQLYFVVLAFPQTNLVLARKPRSEKAFIKQEDDQQAIATPSLLRMEYFNKDFFIRLEDFKKELGRHFGITMKDVDEDLGNRNYRRNNAKSPTPTVRSFMSFMLQHQNLVANKHVIFYRFDEKEKREQTIDHLKIFLGYANQEYFLLCQTLSGLRDELHRIEQQMPRREEERKQATSKIEGALQEFVSITGTKMVAKDAAGLVMNPAGSLEEIRQSVVRIDSLADEASRQRAELDVQRSQRVADLRKLDRQRSAALSSIKFVQEYMEEAQAVVTPDKAEITVSQCPFCHRAHEALGREVDRLQEAIQWLNDELRRSPYLRESFEVDEHRLSAAVGIAREQVRHIEAQIAALDDQTAELERGRPVGELAVKAKLRVEGILEDLLVKPSRSLDEEKSSLQHTISKLQAEQSHYDVNGKLKEAERYVQAAMADIGSKFDFEASYKPINLRFSFDSFDLWHEADKGRPIFLRAMGSGANWLYCHLTLFMSLHKLFCSLGERCKLPPILFLDQPSQVYFPSFSVDNDKEFNPADLAKMAGKENRLDDDIAAVEDLYGELVRYCNETLNETGIKPQIIVTDHADNLKLKGEVSFDSLVRARWRDRGFIHPLPEKQYANEHAWRT